MSYEKQTTAPIAQMRSSSNDRMISCSQLLVDLNIPIKALSNKSWVMEQLTLLKKQFPVEEVKTDIMFQFKWCICMLRLHRNILTILKKIGYQFVRGSRWWKTLVLSSSATLNEHSWCSQKIGVVVRYIGKPFCT